MAVSSVRPTGMKALRLRPIGCFPSALMSSLAGMSVSCSSEPEDDLACATTGDDEREEEVATGAACSAGAVAGAAEAAGVEWGDGAEADAAGGAAAGDGSRARGCAVLEEYRAVNKEARTGREHTGI